MELPHLGEHCCMENCKTLDFLPFKCECKLVFCKEHHKTHILECSFIKKNDQTRTVSNTITYICSFPKCQNTGFLQMLCVQCNRHFCVTHRYHVDCYNLMPCKIQSKQSTAMLEFQHAKMLIDKEINHNLNKAKAKPSRSNTAQKIQLMCLKNKAVGLKNIPLSERVYVLCEYMTKNGAKLSSPFYVNMTWSLGRVIDFLADKCNITNNNNVLNAKKVALFNKLGEHLSNDTSTSVHHLIENGIIVNGDTIVIDYLNETNQTPVNAVGDLKSIFTETLKSISLSEMIMACASVKIAENDGLPAHICTTCFQQLNQAYVFKKRCEEVDSALHVYVYNSNITKETLQSEDRIKEESITFDIDFNVIQPEVLVSVNGKQKEIENKKFDNIHDEDTFSNDFDNNGIIENEDVESSDIKEKEEIKLRYKGKKFKTKTLKSINHKQSSSTYKCKKCDVAFESLKDFNAHMEIKNHPYKRVACNVCGKLISFRHVDTHMRTHTKEKPYSCHMCGKRFSLSGNLRRHVMTHTGERPHQCKICGKGFIQAVSLETHMRVHTGIAPFICSFCGRAFKQSKQCQIHMKNKHIEPSEPTDRRKRSITHISKKTTDDVLRPFVCNICQRAFTTKIILQTHSLRHGEKTFLCSECGKGFVSKVGLDSHSIVHSGIKPYQCNICTKSFAYSGSLKIHMLKHTGEKPYSCDLCNKRFTQSTHLKTHIRLHKGIKPYNCSVCGKDFSQKGNLTVHMRTHTGETPFVCPVCGKGFYDSSSMRKHHRGHI